MSEANEIPREDGASDRRDALLARLGEAGTAMLEVYTVFFGERFGYYDALAERGLTSSELAARTGTHERFVREWLEQQSVAGLLMTDDASLPPQERRFSLPSGHDEVLADRDSLNYWAGQARLLVGVARPLDAILNAFRTGGGVPFDAYGADVREGLSNGSRVLHQEMIGSSWLPAMPDVHARMQADPPARVADVGCGAGWLSIGIARAYPGVRIDGFDLDAESVALANQHVAEAGLDDRVTISCRDAGDPELAGHYDLVTAFTCIHDMSRPVAALKTMRALAGSEGTVFISDLRSGERFLDAANDRDVERLYYGFSLLHCLPVGMAEQPSAATGSIMRPDVLRGYAAAAGFSGVEILPIEDAYSTYYRLRT